MSGRVWNQVRNEYYGKIDLYEIVCIGTIETVLVNVDQCGGFIKTTFMIVIYPTKGN